MGIQIANAVSMPAVTYDKIHMTRLEIVQPVFTDDAQQPVYQVVIYYRHYGVTDGVRYYMNEDVQRASIEDFMSVALSKANAGDTTLLSALQSIETAIATIIAEQSGLQVSVV